MEPIDYLKKIENAGFEAYIVGGYVRDKILGIESSDIDIATDATPKDIADIFEISNKDNLGSINIKTNKFNIDITTYRKECNYMGHHPRKLSYVDDLKTDLMRRDFTINAICMNSKGEIIDLLNGKEDLDNRVLRVIGNIKKKFTEDPLRMLRAVRLACIYDLKINDDELIFILNNKDLFKKISYDRKKSEIGKILISNNAIKGLNFLKTLGLLDTLEIDFKNDIVKVDDYIGMWSQLSYSDNYHFTKVETQRIENIREIVRSNKVNANTIYKYGLYDSIVAGEILGSTKSDIENIYDNMKIHSESDLKIDGNDIKKILKIDDSPMIKTIKDDIIESILNKDLENEHEKLIEYVLKKWE